MKDKDATSYIKWIFLPLLLLIPLLLIVFDINRATVPQQVFASENTTASSTELEQKDPNRPQHKHPAFTERSEERKAMVALQIEARDVNDPNVLKAMQIVPRHAFVRPSESSLAYIDSALPIDYDQTISQPYIVAFMTQALQLKSDSKVLEIGTGSGYQAAVCAEIAKEVYTIEIVEGLAKSAEKTLKELEYPNVFVRFGDGFFGWPENAPFDAIIGTAAAGRVPEPLLEQLQPGGRMILPYGEAGGLQYLVLIIKDDKGNFSKETVMPVRFVPMTGEVEKTARESEE